MQYNNSINDGNNKIKTSKYIIFHFEMRYFNSFDSFLYFEVQ